MKKLGFVGLGRMGKAMVTRFVEQGIEVVVFNRSSIKVDELVQEISKIKNQKSKISIRQAQDRHLKNKKFGRLIPTYSLRDFVNNLQPPRTIWLMVPHGEAVDEMIGKLLEAGVEKGDILIDGGNSFYKDSTRRYKFLKNKGINYLDVGTSGGLEGARNGACMMAGGDEKIYKKVEPILRLAAQKDGVSYFGPAGAGHFVKMVHNGVEYGMLQAIGEGFEILEKSDYKLDLHKVAFNWTKGSVVRGWLMDLLERALKSDPKLESIEGVIGGGSTGGWTVEVAKELGVETPAIEISLEERKKSIDRPTFSGKVIAALRREFGGHEIKIKNQKSKIKT